MAGGIIGGADNEFSYKMILFAMAIIVLFPTFLTIFTFDDSENEDYQELMNGYRTFTGSNAPTNEQIWGLTGIYTPFYTGAYGYTEDGWLYGAVVGEASPYVPSQYKGTLQEAGVQRGDDGFYRYTADTDYGDHKKGDMYTAVTMDVAQQSDVFFTASGKHSDVNGRFYYDFSGYRYAFQPLANYTAEDTDGNRKDVVATTTSLSLIWYNYYGQSGISGQLIISGSDSGVAYLTASQIVSAFSTVTSTASFKLTFNGVPMNVYIRLDPSMIASGYTVEQCYNNGFWEIMVTSLSTDSDSYMGTDYSFNIYAIWDTLKDLFTFNAEDLGITGPMAIIAGLVIAIPLYAALISIGMSFYPVLIFAGILAAIQAISIF